MFMVIDFEATCTNTSAFPRREMEIIEIGAVLCNSDHNLISSFQSFIQPVRHPILTDFCIELTSIQQEQVNSAPKFPEVIDLFLHWQDTWQASQAIFCSWGNFDKRILQENCRFHAVPYPFQEHINLKKSFAKKQRCRSVGMTAALKRVNLPLSGSHHRGIDDARNIATLLPYCL